MLWAKQPTGWWEPSAKPSPHCWPLWALLGSADSAPPQRAAEIGIP